MDKLFSSCSIVIGVALGIGSWLFGAWDTMIKVLLAVMALDYVTGVVKGVYNKRLSSEIGYKGLLKKIVILIVVALANIIQVLIGDNVAIRYIVISFYIANEGISILENAAVIMPSMPKKLRDILLQLRGDDDSNETD